MQNNENKDPVIKKDLPVEAISEVPLQKSESEDTNTLLSVDEIEGLSKKQLADKLAEYLEMDDTNSIFSEAKLIKDKLDELAKEEFERKLQVFIQDGSPAEDFEPKLDSLDEKVKLTWKSINSKRISQRRQKEKEGQENLSAKKMIIEELKELLKGNENFSASYHKFQALQSKWRSTGNVPPQENHTLRENYFFLSGKFYDMVKINNELRELDRKKNDELKNQLCEKAELLAEGPSIKKALSGLGQLQKEWSEIRNFTRELNDNLWQRFKTARDKIIEQKKEYELRQKQQQEANLTAKTELCRQMELLGQSGFVSHKACREASEKENAIWEEWQKIGFVPKSDNGNCWIQFKKSRQNFHKLLDAYYAKQRREFGSNLEKKNELCLKAEALQESKDWVATAEILKKLQIEWKNIGPVAPKDSEPVWMRFRKACDHYFTNKANYHLAKENALRANILAREAIIAKTDLFKPSGDISQSIEEIKKLQDEWAHAGEAPLKDRERLNHTFERTIEKLLERIKGSSIEEEKLFYRLKYGQMLKSPNGIEQIKKERFVLNDKIKKLQAEVIQLDTNLSFFGKSKNSTPLIAEYQEKLEKARSEVKDLQTKLKFIPTV